MVKIFLFLTWFWWFVHQWTENLFHFLLIWWRKCKILNAETAHGISFRLFQPHQKIKLHFLLGSQPIKKQCGSHLKMTGDANNKLKRAVKHLTKAGEHIAGSKLLAKTHVDLNSRTVYCEGLKYKDPINLFKNDNHKAKWHQSCQKWSNAGVINNNIIFINQMHFSLDCPDLIKTWKSNSFRKKNHVKWNNLGGYYFTQDMWMRSKIVWTLANIFIY